MKDFSRYLMRCLPKWGKSSGGITRFSLTKAVNKGGIAYTKVWFKMERALTDGEMAEIAPLVLNTKAISQTLTVEAKEEMMDGKEQKKNILSKSQMNPVNETHSKLVA